MAGAKSVPPPPSYRKALSRAMPGVPTKSSTCKTAASATILVIGPPWPTAEVPQTVLQVRDIVGAAASAAGATFVDPIAERWFVGRPDLIGADGVHPNDAGHAYIANMIAPLIGAQLARRP